MNLAFINPFLLDTVIGCYPVQPLLTWVIQWSDHIRVEIAFPCLPFPQENLTICFLFVVCHLPCECGCATQVVNWLRGDSIMAQLWTRCWGYVISTWWRRVSHNLPWTTWEEHDPYKDYYPQHTRMWSLWPHLELNCCNYKLWTYLAQCCHMCLDTECCR
jgi:hypothetical protein